MARGSLIISPTTSDAEERRVIETRAKLCRRAQALIEHLQLVIAKMKRELFGPRSSAASGCIDQLELQLEEAGCG